MKTFLLFFLSCVLQVSLALKEGRLSATELCRKCINQIQRTRFLNAYITITEEQAMEQAQRADDRLRTGVLCVSVNKIYAFWLNNNDFYAFLYVR